MIDRRAVEPARLTIKGPDMNHPRCADACRSASARKRSLLLCALTAFAGVAYADCKPVIAAFQKTDATQRFAIYSVDDLNDAPKGEPMFVTIGDAKYSEHNVRKGPLTIVKDGYTKGPASAGFEAESVRKDEQSGSKKCTALADRKVGNEMAVGYHVGSPGAKPNSLDPGAMDVWISRTTGLLVAMAPDTETGGFRYVYGSPVVAPPASQIRK